MKEGFPQAALFPNNSCGVSTRITAHPLSDSSASTILLEEDYGRFGWRSWSMLITAFLILGTVVSVPIVVVHMRIESVGKSEEQEER